MIPVEVPSAPSDLPPPRPLDRQGWFTFLAGALLLLISFTTNYGDDNLLHFVSLKTAHQIGMGLHLAALAALVGDVELASRLRHRAANEAIRAERSRERAEAAREREEAARKREAAAREREALDVRHSYGLSTPHLTCVIGWWLPGDGGARQVGKDGIDAALTILWSR